jgi:hypothetical protein
MERTLAEIIRNIVRDAGRKAHVEWSEYKDIGTQFKVVTDIHPLGMLGLFINNSNYLSSFDPSKDEVYCMFNVDELKMIKSAEEYIYY